MTVRDLASEETAREFTGWLEAQGQDRYEEFARGDMADAFAAGMQAERDLAAVREAR